jgi:hypothetical protein
MAEAIVALNKRRERCFKIIDKPFDKIEHVRNYSIHFLPAQSPLSGEFT